MPCVWVKINASNSWWGCFCYSSLKRGSNGNAPSQTDTSYSSNVKQWANVDYLCLLFFCWLRFCFIFCSCLTSVHDSEVLLLFHLAMRVHLVSKTCDSIFLAGERERASHNTPCATQRLVSCLKEGSKSYSSLEAWKGIWEHHPSMLPLLISRCSFSKRHLPRFFFFSV